MCTGAATTLLRGGGFAVTLAAGKGKSLLRLSDGKTEKTLPLAEKSRDVWRTVEIDPAAEGLALPLAGTVWRAEVGRNPVYGIELL